jgi:hypothetical protein
MLNGESSLVEKYLSQNFSSINVHLYRCSSLQKLLYKGIILYKKIVCAEASLWIIFDRDSTIEFLYTGDKLYTSTEVPVQKFFYTGKPFHTYCRLHLYRCRNSYIQKIHYSFRSSKQKSCNKKFFFTEFLPYRRFSVQQFLCIEANSTVQKFPCTEIPLQYTVHRSFIQEKIKLLYTEVLLYVLYICTRNLSHRVPSVIQNVLNIVPLYRSSSLLCRVPSLTENFFL